MPYERISPNLKRAIVAAEDAHFVDHEGFDWDAIEKALEKNRKKGKRRRRRLDHLAAAREEPVPLGRAQPWRKGQEALITVMIEHVMDKRRILELYLNVIEWGDGVFGAEAAARHYFGVGAAALGAGAVRAARGDGAEPALLRPQPQHALARAQDADDPRAHAAAELP